MDEQAIVEGVIQRVSGYLTDPPRGSDPVISYASPSALAQAFATTVGLALGDRAAVHNEADVLAAVEQVIDY